MDYRKELNPEQYQAVTQIEGPILILAGAGSGKTRVITYRIAYMVGEAGISPYQILAITFTNKAANEMRERVDRMLGGDASGVWISTFHRFCGRILRNHAQAVGYTNTFNVYDEKDVEKVIKDCLHELNIDSKYESPAALRATISKFKNDMLSPAEFAEYANKGGPAERTLLRVYRLYEKKMKESNAMDFDDMLLNCVRLFEENPDILELYSGRFRYVMVDEYQDTNKVQYRLISLLASHGNLCVVGDDDQSIYGFRGADVRNILDFEKQFPDCTIIKLEQNYRSTSHILDAANGVISEIGGRRQSKNLWTEKEGGERVARFTAETQIDEASFVARQIQSLVADGGYRYKDFAVLYRQNSLSQNVESACMRYQIPFKVYGGMKYFERQEVKVAVNYLRLFENPNDRNALRAIINVPKRAIGEKGVDSIFKLADNNGVSPMRIVSDAAKYTELSRYASQLRQFSDAFYEVLLEKDELSVSDFIKKVYEAFGLLEYYALSDEKNDETRVDNLGEFINVAKDYEQSANEDETLENTLSGFLQNVSLSTDMDEVDDPDQSFVTLMTVHASKGLEFPVVFVISMEDGIFPSQRSLEESGGQDEERRLFYVAITRAKERLFITNAKQRMLYGQTKMNAPSPLLRSIPAEHVKNVNFFGKEVQGASFGTARSRYPSYGEKGDYLTYGDSEYYDRGYNKKYGSGYGNSGYGGSNYGKRNRSDDLFSDDRDFSQPVQTSSQTGFNKKPDDTASKLAKAKFEAKAGDNKEVSVGDRVLHPKYGEGTVTSIEGELTSTKDDRICEIVFDKFGMKRFMMCYTKLKKLD
jgi:DNA helicase-2/ATP-dependent DNA helicase PcrA